MIDVVKCHCEKCCACVLLRVNGCIPVPKKQNKTKHKKCEKEKSTWSILRLFNQLFLKFANNYSFIYLCKSLSGFSWRKCSFVHFGQLKKFTSNNQGKDFYLCLVKQIKRVAFITCFYVRQYIILFADVFVYLKVNILIMCKKKKKKMHLCERLDTFF